MDARRILNRNPASKALVRLLGTLIVALIQIALSAAPVLNNDVSEKFTAANRLYEEGHYTDAASAYESLLGEGNISASIYFNIGNAYFKSGRPGLAAAHYRLAAFLTPRDSEIQKNLAFVNASLRGRPAPSGSFWNRPTFRLTLNELTLLAAFPFWVWMAGRLFRLFRPVHSQALRILHIVSGASASLLGMWLIWRTVAAINVPNAIAVAPEVVVRFGPLEESPGHYTVLEGAELFLLDRKQDWMQVRDHMARTGWVRQDRLIILPRW